MRDFRQQRFWVLVLAFLGWVTGFWLCRGRWEHQLWLQWALLPAFALNADRVWILWKEWFGDLSTSFRGRLWWLGLFSLLEWHFWVTGFRTGDWWLGAGSGRDLLVMLVLVSGLTLFARKKFAEELMWPAIFIFGSLTIVCSAALFYQDYGVSEQRFRLVWRYEPGFNAVTTGILVGFALVTGWISVLRFDSKKFRFLGWLALVLLGGALAASESRGALLAALSAGAIFLGRAVAAKEQWFSHLRLLLLSAGGFICYWVLALWMGEASQGDLVSRGSSGRLEIYQYYLANLSTLDWWLGKGEVPALPPSALGWEVHHPHSAYLGQLVAYGVMGALGLGWLLMAGFWQLRREKELSLLVFGLIACLFDGGLILSAFSMARWEVLVVLVPLVMGVARLQRVESSSEIVIDSVNENH